MTNETQNNLEGLIEGTPITSEEYEKVVSQLGRRSDIRKGWKLGNLYLLMEFVQPSKEGIYDIYSGDWNFGFSAILTRDEPKEVWGLGNLNLNYTSIWPKGECVSKTFDEDFEQNPVMKDGVITLPISQRFYETKTYYNEHYREYRKYVKREPYKKDVRNITFDIKHIELGSKAHKEAAR